MIVVGESAADNGWHAGLRWLAAPRWSVLFFLTTAAGALAVVFAEGSPTVWMAVPFALLLLNLLAAIFSLPRFRADLPLLIFHVALLMLVVLVVLARLTYFEAGATLSRDSSFEGILVADERGPLYGEGYKKLRFANLGYTTNYNARGRYQATYNRISWLDSNGRWHEAEIGDDHPLVMGDYRIYTTGNRGFTLIMGWKPTGGALEYGAVELDDPGADGFASTATWQLPNGEEIWGMISANPNGAGAGSSIDNLGVAEQSLPLVLRVAEQRHEMALGETIELDGGRLSYQQLESWMGYQIIYDPARNWIVATVLIGILSLIWFYLGRIWGKGSLDSDR